MQISEFTFRRARAEDAVEPIAHYIYDTDGYIYPCVARDWRDTLWLNLIRTCFHTPGDVFWWEHLYVAERNGQILALACVLPGGTDLTFARRFMPSESMAEGLETAVKGYFQPLIEENKRLSGYNIANFCVDSACRGLGLGSAFMAWLVSELGDKDIWLDVILANSSAIRLYEKAGFRKVAEYSGFSGSEEVLPCMHMLRKHN